MGFIAMSFENWPQWCLECFHWRMSERWLRSGVRITSLISWMVSFVYASPRSLNQFQPVGKMCFVCESEGMERNTEGSNVNSCPCCHAILETPPKLLAHITAHIIYDSSINREDEPCGLCLLPLHHARLLWERIRSRSFSTMETQLVLGSSSSLTWLPVKHHPQTHVWTFQLGALSVLRVLSQWGNIIWYPTMLRNIQLTSSSWVSDFIFQTGGTEDGLE